MATQQADLPCVQHLVVGAPQQRQQLRLRKRVRVRHGLIQFVFVEAQQFLKHLPMHSVQHRTEFGWRVRRIRLRHRARQAVRHRAASRVDGIKRGVKLLREQAAGHAFDSVEVKKSFRIDGLFLPS